LTFEVLPPVDGRWSLTVYPADTGLLYENEIHRYAIGSTTPGLVSGSGSELEILLRHRSPADPSNWLPVPDGRFYVDLRLWEPRPEARDGRSRSSCECWARTTRPASPVGAPIRVALMAPFRGIFERIVLSDESVLDTSLLFAVIMASNLTGAMLCCQGAARLMISSTDQSVRALQATSGRLAYSVTKAAVNQMGRERVACSSSRSSGNDP
jgi:Protein of unknown function (DUF1214)